MSKKKHPVTLTTTKENKWTIIKSMVKNELKMKKEKELKCIHEELASPLPPHRKIKFAADRKDDVTTSKNKSPPNKSPSPSTVSTSSVTRRNAFSKKSYTIAESCTSREDTPHLMTDGIYHHAIETLV